MKKRQQNSTESTAILAPEQTAVIMALMAGGTVTDATKQANVDRTTYYLWLKSDATFYAELNRAKREQTDTMRAQLRSLADTAVATVREMLTGTEVPPGVRLKAAVTNSGRDGEAAFRQGEAVWLSFSPESAIVLTQ